MLEVLDIISVNGNKDIRVVYNRSAYNENESDNAWEYYFEPVNNDTKKKYRLFLTTRPFRNLLISQNPKLRSVFSEILADRVKIKKDILDKANFFAEKYFKNKKILAVHYRGTDVAVTINSSSHIFTKAPVEKYFDEINQLIDNCDAIFLATDDENAFDSFKKKYGEKIVSYSSIRSRNRVGIHHGESSKRLAREEAVIDALLLSKGDFLIHGQSNLSTFVSFLNGKLLMKNLDLRK